MVQQVQYMHHPDVLTLLENIPTITVVLYFPGAVDKGMIAEIKPNGTNKVRAYSIDLKDYVEFGLNEEDAPKASWARYIFGVLSVK